jgi:hypothetical protein
MYQAAGVFDDVKFQATEFTPKDSYQMSVFESDGRSHWPLACQRDGLPYCQINGDYLLDLPGFNQVAVYNNMNQKCSGYLPHFDASIRHGC